MGTTRIKVIDLSSDQKEIKTSRKHAEKLAGFAAREKAEKETKKVEVKDEKPEVEESEIAQLQESETQEEPAQTPQEEQPKAAKKAKTKSQKKQTHHLGKKYKEAKKLVEEKLYAPKEALDLLPKISFTKFDPTVELHLTVSEKNMKGSVALPHPFETKKKESKILVFSEIKNDEKNIIWGDAKTIEEIEKGTLKPSRDFDIVYSTPKFMPDLTKIAKVLGPKGLMPNPKNGTIIASPKDIAKKADSAGSYDYKTDPTAPVVHTKLGKLSAKSDNLEANLKALITSIGAAKIKNATLTSTMSPAIKLDIFAS